MRILFLSIFSIIIILNFQLNANAVYIEIGTPNSNVHYMLIDYNGKRTGYDPVSKIIVSETGLPVMTYYQWAVEGYPQYMLQGEFPVDMVPLNMKLVLTGTKLAANSRLSIIFTENQFKTGIQYPQNELSIAIFPVLDIGQVITYDIVYTPLKSIAITKVATSNDLIADITTAQKLNLIGNAKFVAELTKEINEIEAEKTKGKIDDGLTSTQKAKKEYTELLKEITEKYNKPEGDEFVKQEAYTVLKEDLEYIINHL